MQYRKKCCKANHLLLRRLLKLNFMKRTLGIALLIAGLAIGIFGYNKLGDSAAGIEIGDLELTAQDQGKENQAYILLALGAVGLLGGIYVLSKK